MVLTLRQRISDLLDTEIEIARIIDIVKCFRSLVFKMKNDGENFPMKVRSGGRNLKGIRTSCPSWRTKLRSTAPKLINRLVNAISVAARTIKRAVKSDLGIYLYTRIPENKKILKHFLSIL
uniref:Uncharacterized protein n=1 Tax=Lepeophtheirus salmonis TaxID=72036 RepID=A0A0K2UUR5_LEPSM